MFSGAHIKRYGTRFPLMGVRVLSRARHDVSGERLKTASNTSEPMRDVRGVQVAVVSTPPAPATSAVSSLGD